MRTEGDGAQWSCHTRTVEHRGRRDTELVQIPVDSHGGGLIALSHDSSLRPNEKHAWNRQRPMLVLLDEKAVYNNVSQGTMSMMSLRGWKGCRRAQSADENEQDGMEVRTFLN